MKISINKLLILFCLCGTLLGIGCKKDGYLTGGTLHTAITPLNNMDYLKGNSFNLFDTAALVIEKFGLATEVNNAKTFFAFTDYAIGNFMRTKLQAKQVTNPLALYTLDSLYKDIDADSVRQYMFSQTIELESAPELTAAPYTSLGKTNMAAIKILQTGIDYTRNTLAPTYLLYFVKVRGALDQPGVTPPVNESDISVVCQTTGIKTSNGNTTLHVLSNGHVFVRF